VHLILGISGGIAAYKTPEIVRRLKAQGCQVKVVMTSGAQAFITPLTLQAISGERVHTALFDPEAELAMGHIALAKWADVLLVAPASANTMARFAHGVADDLLSTLYLATQAPTIMVPAMNQVMWSHPATQANTKLLAARGVQFWGPAEGEQACGDVGLGRMLEPEEIVTRVLSCCRE
jgi:phosphopantothenoylcysteine decarboxylase/phosphopantothenate--cysteine ligase